MLNLTSIAGTNQTHRNMIYTHVQEKGREEIQPVNPKCFHFCVQTYINLYPASQLVCRVFLEEAVIPQHSDPRSWGFCSLTPSLYRSPLLARWKIVFLPSRLSPNTVLPTNTGFNRAGNVVNHYECAQWLFISCEFPFVRNINNASVLVPFQPVCKIKKTGEKGEDESDWIIKRSVLFGLHGWPASQPSEKHCEMSGNLFSEEDW